MGKYASWAEFEATVPGRYEEAATKEAFVGGLDGIAPPGEKTKPERGDHYEAGTKGKGKTVVERFRQAMYTRK